MPLGPSPAHIKRVSSVVLWLSNNPFQARPGIPGSAVPHHLAGQDRSEVGGDHTPLPTAVKPPADFFLLSRAFTHPTRAQMHRRYRPSPFQRSIFTPKKGPCERAVKKLIFSLTDAHPAPPPPPPLPGGDAGGAGAGLGAPGPAGLAGVAPCAPPCTCCNPLLAERESRR